MSEVKTNKISSLASNNDITIDPDGTGDTIIASGNLGVGTSSPNALLTMVAADGIMADQYVAKFTNSEATAGQNYGVFVAGGSTSADESFSVRKFDNSATYFKVRGDGNVGIGTAAPSYQATIFGSSTSTVEIESGSDTGESRIYFTDPSTTGIGEIGYYHNGNSMRFNVGNAESMRLIPAPSDKGTLCIGRTTNIGGSRLVVDADGDNENPISVVQQHAGSSSEYLLLFYRGNDSDGYVLTGHIQNTNNATAYNTSSDYRLKTNVSYNWDATSRLKQLKPARFEWISDGDSAVPVDGFIAHEVSSIVPEAISGTKDAMTDAVLYIDGDEIPDGKNVGDVKTEPQIKPQAIDQSKLVPLLVKTIQELEARITALEAE